MKNPVYYNGVICPFENASIPLTDRSIFFADAVYDVMIGRNKAPYQFKRHISRFRDNCDRIGLDIPQSDEEISDIIKELISLSPYREFYVYIQASGNSEKRAHKRDTATGNLLVMLSEISVPKEPKAVDAVFFPDMRYEYCAVKTTNLLPSVLSVMNAAEAGADIAIFHRGKVVTEASYANVFIVRNNKLLTPPLSKHLLPGITRENIISAASRLGIKCAEDELTKDDVLTADAVILTSTTKLIQLCSRIDGIPISQSGSDIARSIFNILYGDFLGFTE